MMAANIRQSVQELLERHPGLRVSTNALVMGYWLHVDGYGTREKDFAKTTPLESIVREARNIWNVRPDLSPIANQAVACPDLFAGATFV